MSKRQHPIILNYKPHVHHCLNCGRKYDHEDSKGCIILIYGSSCRACTCKGCGATLTSADRGGHACSQCRKEIEQ